MAVVRRVLAQKTLKAGKEIARSIASASVKLSLPTEPKKSCMDFFRYASLIYGRPGIGKTTWAASFPESLLLSCERVSKGIECFDFNAENGGVKNWDVFRQAVDLLEASPTQFATVIIDTIDAAYLHCLTWVCAKMGIAHPQDEGYGKGWDAVRKEFTETMDRLWATGRGIVFISHAKEIQITSHSGEEFSRIQPTMSGQAYSFIKAKTDFVLYCEYYRDAEGNPMRVLITSGDDIVDAKSAGDLPRFLPFTKGDGVQIIVDAFAGKDVGINAADLRAGKQTSQGGSNLVTKARTEAAKKSRKILAK